MKPRNTPIYNPPYNPPVKSLDSSSYNGTILRGEIIGLGGLYFRSRAEIWFGTVRKSVRVQVFKNAILNPQRFRV